MNPRPEIRAARLGDAAEIARLSGELGYPAGDDFIRANLTALLHAPQYFVAVAQAHGSQQLAGWIVAERRLSLESGETIEITGLVVAGATRRLGAGTALVAATEAWAARLGFRSIRVRSNIVRLESHAFYQGIGFRPAKTQHTYEKPLSNWNDNS